MRKRHACASTRLLTLSQNGYGNKDRLTCNKFVSTKCKPPANLRRWNPSIASCLRPRGIIIEFDGRNVGLPSNRIKLKRFVPPVHAQPSNQETCLQRTMAHLQFETTATATQKKTQLRVRTGEIKSRVCPGTIHKQRRTHLANPTHIRRSEEHNHELLENREEQIIETRDKPQHLDIQRYLSCLQYPDETKSSTKDLSLPPFNLKISWH